MQVFIVNHKDTQRNIICEVVTFEYTVNVTFTHAHFIKVTVTLFVARVGLSSSPFPLAVAAPNQCGPHAPAHTSGFSTYS